MIQTDPTPTICMSLSLGATYKLDNTSFIADTNEYDYDTIIIIIIMKMQIITSNVFAV